MTTQIVESVMAQDLDLETISTGLCPFDTINPSTRNMSFSLEFEFRYTVFDAPSRRLGLNEQTVSLLMHSPLTTTVFCLLKLLLQKCYTTPWGSNNLTFVQDQYMRKTNVRLGRCIAQLVNMFQQFIYAYTCVRIYLGAVNDGDNSRCKMSMQVTGSPIFNHEKNMYFDTKNSKSAIMSISIEGHIQL